MGAHRFLLFLLALALLAPVAAADCLTDQAGEEVIGIVMGNYPNCVVPGDESLHDCYCPWPFPLTAQVCPLPDLP